MTLKSANNQINTILNNSELLPVQRDVLVKFVKDMRINQGLSILTMLSQVSKIGKLARMVKKPFSEMNRNDIEGLLYTLTTSQATIDQYKIVIKKFFKWYYQTEVFPENVKWIKVRNNNKHKLPEDILTPVEIKKMIEVTTNTRDKAIVSVLYESAARLDELVALKQKNVFFDQYGARIIVDGKTGTRPIRLINSAPDLLLWMNNIPIKNPDSVVFSNQHNINKDLGHDGIYSLIKRTAKLAGITKNVHPHILRHSRLTELAKELTDSELKVYAGWTMDSNMAAVYVHMNGGDVEKKILANSGLISREEADKEENLLKPRMCPRCRESNPSTAKFCPKCGMALDLETAAKIDKGESGMTLEVMDLMQREPRLLEILKSFVVGKA